MGWSSEGRPPSAGDSRSLALEIRCFSGRMPIPLYAPPPMRSSRSPNPFDRAQAPQLRILVDAPLAAGPVDGAGDYHGYPFQGGGSTGYPDAATVLRSYF